MTVTNGIQVISGSEGGWQCYCTSKYVVNPVLAIRLAGLL